MFGDVCIDQGRECGEETKSDGGISVEFGGGRGSERSVNTFS